MQKLLATARDRESRGKKNGRKYAKDLDKPPHHLRADILISQSLNI
ncbi:MAG: hypothetical protein HY526_11790 [Betaproteobacteria bacterium]|nr:hypothetical protein [Betaproteobacteria bacterium]